MNHKRHVQKQSFWVADLTCLFLGSERVMLQAHFLKFEMKRFIHIPQCISYLQRLKYPLSIKKVCKWSTNCALKLPLDEREQDLHWVTLDLRCKPPLTPVSKNTRVKKKDVPLEGQTYIQDWWFSVQCTNKAWDLPSLSSTKKVFK